MKIEILPITSITPYARNPRRNEGIPVSKVKASLKEFGWQQPIVVDKDMTIVVGHTRYMAAMELGMKEVPVHVAADLTPTQIKAYRLADNKTATFSEWDMELLALEIDDLKAVDFDLDLTGFDADELAGIELDGEPGGGGEGSGDDTYSRKIEAPIYEPTGPCPKLANLYDVEKYNALISEIDAAPIPKDVAEFLKLAATRHQVFNFRQIAEFYAHSESPIQHLMEKSGLVIIDFNKAIEYGFVHLTERLGQIADLEGYNEDEG